MSAGMPAGKLSPPPTALDVLASVTSRATRNTVPSTNQNSPTASPTNRMRAVPASANPQPDLSNGSTPLQPLANRARAVPTNCAASSTKGLLHKRSQQCDAPEGAGSKFEGPTVRTTSRGFRLPRNEKILDHRGPIPPSKTSWRRGVCPLALPSTPVAVRPAGAEAPGRGRRGRAREWGRGGAQGPV